MPKVTKSRAKGKKNASSANLKLAETKARQNVDRNDDEEEDILAVPSLGKTAEQPEDSPTCATKTPVVTPLKIQHPRPPSPCEEQTFYVINMETHGYFKFETKDLALNYFETTRKINPEAATNLMVQDFPSDEALIAHIDALKMMSTKKPINNPMAAMVKTVALPPPVMLAPIPDSKPAAKRPKLGFSSGSDKSMTANELHMKRFEEALRNSSSKLDVFHKNLDGSNWDVWGFALKENNDYYWSWKPNVLEKAIVTEQVHRLFEKEETTMDEMLSSVRAALVRETPGGPNIASAFTLKNGKKMDRMILFGLLPSPTCEMSVKEIAATFCNQCKNPKIRLAYAIAMDSTMKADSIKKDVGENGQLWEKLASASNNIVYRQLGHLSEVFCDHTIEEIIRLTYGYSGGDSPSMWDRRVFKLAYGEARESKSG